MRVLIDRPDGKERRATFVAYLPPNVALDTGQVRRYYGPKAPPGVERASKYGRFVFLIDGTHDGFFICPDSAAGRRWWRKLS